MASPATPPRADADVRALVGRLNRLFAYQVRGPQRAAQCRNGLQVAADDHIFTVGDATFETAGPIGGADEAALSGVILDFVSYFTAVRHRGGHAGPDFGGFHGLNGHECARQLPIKFGIPLRVTAETRRHAVSHHFKYAPDGITGTKHVIDLLLHARFGFGIDAAQRRIEIRADRLNFSPRGGAFQANMSDGDNMAQDIAAKFAQQKLRESPRRDPRRRSRAEARSRM